MNTGEKIGIFVGVLAVVLVAFGLLQLDVNEKNAQIIEPYYHNDSKGCDYGIKTVFLVYKDCIDYSEWKAWQVGTKFENYTYYGLIPVTDLSKTGFNTNFVTEESCALNERWVPYSHDNITDSNGTCKINYISLVVFSGEYSYYDTFIKGKITELSWNGEFLVTLESGSIFNFISEDSSLQIGQIITIKKEVYKNDTCYAVEIFGNGVHFTLADGTSEELLDIARTPTDTYTLNPWGVKYNKDECNAVLDPIYYVVTSQN